MALVASVLGSRHANKPEVHFKKTKRITIEAAQPLEVWADGEHVATTPVTIEVVPGAVEVMLPADSSLLTSVNRAGRP